MPPVDDGVVTPGSLDGFPADENDHLTLFDWLPRSSSVRGGAVKVSQASFDYTRPYWDQIGPTHVGRHA